MQVWNRGRTISHRVCRYNHMHFSGNWPRLPIVTSLGRDNVKAIEKPKKKVWLSVTDCPTSEQGIAEKKEKNNPWTTSFPFFSGLLLQRLITQSDSDSSHTTRPWTPRHHSRQQTSCFMGTSTFRFISQEKRRTGGVRACPLIFTFTRNQHREDVRRSLHCGFSVRWVTSYLCLTAAVAARRRNNTLCFVFQDPLRGSKVNHFPSTVHSAACVGFVSQPFFSLPTRMWILLHYKHGVCHGHHCLWYHPDHPHHCICLLPCDSSQETEAMGAQWWWALIY